MTGDSKANQSRGDLVSVVVSTFNRIAWLRQAVRSVLTQTHENLELVVVNNGASDGTTEYLASLTDPRVRIVHHEQNIGMIPGQNSGLSVARGRWLALIDDDDVWASKKIASQLSEIDSSESVWSTAGCVYVDANLEVIGGNPPGPVSSLMKNLTKEYTLQAGTSAFLWRKGILESDLMNGQVPNMSDWELALRLAEKGPPALVSEPLVGYRQHDSAMSQKTEVFLFELERMAEINHEIDPAEAKHLVYQFTGSQLLRRNQRVAASHFFIKAIGGGRFSALTRLATVPLPKRTRLWLRLHVYSDAAWINQGEAWLQPLRNELMRDQT